jgi:hypothetical protein
VLHLLLTLLVLLVLHRLPALELRLLHLLLPLGLRLLMVVPKPYRRKRMKKDKR